MLKKEKNQWSEFMADFFYCDWCFQVYNLVGVVRSHDDDDASLVEVDFHDSSTHHSFSLPNSLGHSMAALNSQALVLACARTEDKPR